MISPCFNKAIPTPSREKGAYKATVILIEANEPTMNGCSLSNYPTAYLISFYAE